MPRTRTSSATELLVEVRAGTGEALHHQLERELRSAVRDGRLRSGGHLPSSRAFARELGVSRGVVVEAYAQLLAEGYLVATPGGATRVADAAQPSAASASEVSGDPSQTGPAPRIDLRPGRPDLTLFPREAWIRSVRRVLGSAPSERLGYLDGSGVPELRAALAIYLDRVRGTCATPDAIVVTTGYTQALALVGGVLRRRGVRRVAVEAPGFSPGMDSLASSGLTPVPVPVDGEGLRVDRLARTDADAVLVTPAHQYPTGVVLAPSRRTRLLEWAAERGALVIEDDYDAEFRYDQAPVGALQGLAPERVIHVGTASKILAPGLRMGWVILPTDLVPQVAAAKRAADAGSPSLDQLVLADFIERGELGRHLRHVRAIYRRRRDALLAALRRYLPELEPVGISAGLHALTWLPPGVRADALVTAAAREGLGIEGLIGSDGAERSDGIIFGYAAAGERAIGQGIRILRTLIARARST